ncbi:hypothetical protein AAVH_37157, partial [Aphelenchoides avenae]
EATVQDDGFFSLTGTGTDSVTEPEFALTVHYNCGHGIEEYELPREITRSKHVGRIVVPHNQ